MIASYVDGTLPEGPKRLLYVNMLALGEEGRKKLAETQTHLDDAAFAALTREAVKEFEEAGYPDLPVKLDAFVKLSV